MHTGDLSELFADARIGDPALALFHSTGAFRGHIEGLTVGQTTVTFHFMHPPRADAHADYDSTPLPLTVN